jgi:hypothetical protein
MALFRRRGKDATRSSSRGKGPVDRPSIPGTRRPHQRTELEWGMPSRCPKCGDYGYLDHIDLVDEVMRQHCPTCWYKWTISRQQVDEAAGRRAD